MHYIFLSLIAPSIGQQIEQHNIHLNVQPKALKRHPGAHTLDLDEITPNKQINWNWNSLFIVGERFELDICVNDARECGIASGIIYVLTFVASIETTDRH